MTTVAWALFALLMGLSLLYCFSTWVQNQTIRNLEARLGALALARTPAEYVGMMNTPTDPVVTRPHKVITKRGREVRQIRDDRKDDEVPKMPIGLGGEW